MPPKSKPAGLKSRTNLPNADRILIYGGEGVGKSEAWIDLLLASTGIFHVIDTDGSAYYSLTHASIPDDAAERVYLYTCNDPDGLLQSPYGDTDHGTQWGAITEAARQIRAAKPASSDWIVIDRIDTCWEAVQSHWTAQAYGDNETDYWTNLRAEQITTMDADGKGTTRDYGGFEPNRDWVQIKKVYKDSINRLLATPRCSKVAVALSKEPFPGSKKAAEQRKTYGSLMPAGQKDQGADFWVVVEIKRKKDDSRSVFVRRTKRKGFDDFGPHAVTKDGVCDFVGGFMRGPWGWEG